jgi:FMN phosphatase YigB (HAD superfamily)
VRVRDDWDAYYADLDLAQDGDDGIADLWEGMFRTTRALFREANIAPPDHDGLTVFSRTLAGSVCATFNALHDHAIPFLRDLRERHVQVALIGQMSESQVSGLLRGGDALALCDAVIGADTLGQFSHDANAFRKIAAHVRMPCESCFALCSDARAADAARQAGMTAHAITSLAMAQAMVSRWYRFPTAEIG